MLHSSAGWDPHVHSSHTLSGREGAGSGSSFSLCDHASCQFHSHFRPRPVYALGDDRTCTISFQGERPWCDPFASCLAVRLLPISYLLLFFDACVSPLWCIGIIWCTVGVCKALAQGGRCVCLYTLLSPFTTLCHLLWELLHLLVLHKGVYLYFRTHPFRVVPPLVYRLVPVKGGLSVLLSGVYLGPSTKKDTDLIHSHVVKLVTTTSAAILITRKSTCENMRYMPKMLMMCTYTSYARLMAMHSPFP